MSAVAFPLLQPKSNKVDDEWTHKNCRLIWSSDIFSTLFSTLSFIGFRFDFLEASISLLILFDRSVKLKLPLCGKNLAVAEFRFFLLSLGTSEARTGRTIEPCGPRRQFGSARKRFHAQSARNLGRSKGPEFDRSVKLKDKVVCHPQKGVGPLQWRRPAPM